MDWKSVRRRAWRRGAAKASSAGVAAFAWRRLLPAAPRSLRTLRSTDSRWEPVLRFSLVPPCATRACAAEDRCPFLATLVLVCERSRFLARLRTVGDISWMLRRRARDGSRLVSAVYVGADGETYRPGAPGSPRVRRRLLWKQGSRFRRSCQGSAQSSGAKRMAF